MNILFISKSNYLSAFPPGRRIELPKSLKDLGHITSLISASYTWHKPQIEKENYIDVRLIPVGDLPVLISLFYLFKLPFVLASILFSGNKPDMVITDPSSVLAVLPFALCSQLRMISSKFILDIRTVPVETGGVPGILKNLEYTLAIWLAKYFFEGLTVITGQLRDGIVKQFKINPHSIGIWSSGVSLAVFDSSQANIPDDVTHLQKRFVIMHHGVLGRNRGLKEAIEAVSLLHQEFPDIFLLYVGDGPARDGLKSQVHDLHLENNVLIHDPISYYDVKDYISLACVGLIPLPNIDWWRVSSPQKLLEYLAMEKPVIVTDIPAHRNVINSAICGFYLKSNEPPEIARAIREAYLHKAELKEWGKIGRDIIENDFSWDTQAQNLSNYLYSIALRNVTLRM